jgi:hypothetical protein
VSGNPTRWVEVLAVRAHADVQQLHPAGLQAALRGLRGGGGLHSCLNAVKTYSAWKGAWFGDTHSA